MMRRGVAVLCATGVLGCTPRATNEVGDAHPIDAALSDATLTDVAPPDGPPEDAFDAFDASPDAAPCAAVGAPEQISAVTRPLVSDLLVAENSEAIMVVWGVGSPNRVMWATLANGIVVAHGELAGASLLNTQLRGVGSTFVLHDFTTDELFVFDGSNWVLKTFAAYPAAVSGSNLLGTRGGVAVVFDGANVGAEVPITSHQIGPVAGDGAGGFGVVTVESPVSNHVILRLVTYSGGVWSGESLIADLDIPTAFVIDPVALVSLGTAWAVLYTVDDVPTVSILSNGSWSSTTLSSATGNKFSLAATGGSLAMIGNTGFAAVYANGSWTTEQLEASPGESSPHVVPFAGGFVAVWGGHNATTSGAPLRASVYDGTAWAPAFTLVSDAKANPVDIATSANGIAIGFRTHSVPLPQAVVFANGMWGAPATLGSQTARAMAPEIAIENGLLRAVYVEPGRIDTRVASGTDWSAPSTLPASAVPGRSYGGVLARAGNGHLLAAWEQQDGDDLITFAAEHDGTHWGSPVAIVTQHSTTEPRVTANASAFVVAYTVRSSENGDDDYVATWTGTGLGPATVLSHDARVQIASDGTSFLATWTANTIAGKRTLWSESPSGTTWSSSSVLGPERVRSLIGGSAGVLALTYDTQPSARVWRNGSWSDPANVPSWWANCRGAVAATTALAVCSNQYNLPPEPIQTALFSNGTWTTIPIAGSSSGYLDMILGTDGSDYRLEYFEGSNADVVSTVLSNGAWSAPVASPGFHQAQLVTGVCGRWAMVHGDSPIEVSTATSAGGYVLDHATSLVSPSALLGEPQKLDAAWLMPTATSFGQPMLHVQRGL